MTDLRTIERDSIRAFVQSAADDGYLSGRVLDVGAGLQPYRDIVEAQGSDYIPFDRGNFPGNVSGGDVGEWAMKCDAVLCTQVIQYVPHVFHGETDFAREHYIDGPYDLLVGIYDALLMDSCLVLTYPTNWPEVEVEDLHRFTKAGMERLLTEAGFEIVRHERRASVFGGVFKNSPAGDREEFALGYGCIARA